MRNTRIRSERRRVGRRRCAAPPVSSCSLSLSCLSAFGCAPNAGDDDASSSASAIGDNAEYDEIVAAGQTSRTVTPEEGTAATEAKAFLPGVSPRAFATTMTNVAKWTTIFDEKNEPIFESAEVAKRTNAGGVTTVDVKIKAADNDIAMRVTSRSEGEEVLVEAVNTSAISFLFIEGLAKGAYQVSFRAIPYQGGDHRSRDREDQAQEEEGSRPRPHGEDCPDARVGETRGEPLASAVRSAWIGRNSPRPIGLQSVARETEPPATTPRHDEDGREHGADPGPTHRETWRSTDVTGRRRRWRWRCGVGACSRHAHRGDRGQLQRR